jgi:hypothetical protein
VPQSVPEGVSSSAGIIVSATAAKNATSVSVSVSVRSPAQERWR